MRNGLQWAAILVWCLYMAEAFYEEEADYWHSNDDGILSDFHFPITFYRSNNYYKNSTVLRQNEFDFDDPESVGNTKHLRTKHRKLRFNNNIGPQCFKGRYIIDDCSRCQCIGGQLYRCTAKPCQEKKLLLSYEEKLGSECNSKSFKASPDQCNRCVCRMGIIMCTTKVCDRQKLLVKKCDPGKPVASVDGCNTCWCGKNNDIYCTTKSCRGKTVNGNGVANKELSCDPGSWYSRIGSVHCKECYCVDGLNSFCYLLLCEERRQKLRYNAQRLSLSSKCEKGTIKVDECTHCLCTHKEEWKCFTKISAHCTASRAPSESPQDVKDRPDFRYYGNEYFDESNHPAVSADNCRKGAYMIDHCKECICNNEGLWDCTNKVNGTCTRKIFKKFAGRIRRSKIEKPKHKTRENLVPDREIQLESSEEQLMLSKSGDRVSRSGKLKTIGRPEALRTHSSKGLTYAEVFRDVDFGNRNNPNAECNMGEYFTQGSNKNCWGCFCNRMAKWICYKVDYQCPSYDNRVCSVGSVQQNRVSPCSVCHCQADGTNFCGTDEKCAHQTRKKSTHLQLRESSRPSFCDPLHCPDKCKLRNTNYGVCRRGVCRCFD